MITLLRRFLPLLHLFGFYFPNGVGFMTSGVRDFLQTDGQPERGWFARSGIVKRNNYLESVTGPLYTRALGMQAYFHILLQRQGSVPHLLICSLPIQKPMNTSSTVQHLPTVNRYGGNL
jgi:hypothetical protein